MIENVNYAGLLSTPTPLPYENAVAMDEMVWKKRAVRIKNRDKDKEILDN